MYNKKYLFLKIIWRPVIWGLALQFIFGLLILRTTVGYEFFKLIGDQISIFLDYTDAGAKFVFGDDFTKHYFAFKVCMFGAIKTALFNIFIAS